MNNRESKGEIMVQYKYTFTTEELNEIATKMAGVIKDRDRQEDQKKAVASQFKATIDLLTAQSTELSLKHIDGYEYRDGKCELFLDHKTKKREYISLATGEIVSIEPFRDEDHQPGLFREE